MRPQGILVPRMRQAPDGCTSGGSQPTDISVINRRVLLAPALPIDQGEKNEADVKKLLPTLDIGSHINARVQGAAMAATPLLRLPCNAMLGATVYGILRSPLTIRRRRLSKSRSP
jgi:hypothetical protein